MTRHAEAIIKKMSNQTYWELNFDILLKLTNESERGAILIGTSIVEKYLEKLILKILPTNNKNYIVKILNYPGPMSSFSGKIELCYAFRIIDKRVYDSLNILRKIRNNAAHTNEIYSLQEQKDELEKIYDFEDFFPGLIHELAFNNLLQWKKHTLKEILTNNNLRKMDHDRIWDETIPDPSKNESIRKQLTIWKLAYGLALLCLKIEIIKDEYTGSTL